MFEPGIDDFDDQSVKARLLHAADRELTERGVAASVPMEAIARRAGVSRATAFRQLGIVADVLVQVALLHARRHTVRVGKIMQREAGAISKLEAALVYTARELPKDPVLAALLARRGRAIRDPRVHRVAVDVTEPVLLEGQRDGEVRSDISTDDLVDFLVSSR